MITCLECGKILKIIKHSHLKYQCSGLLKNVNEYKLKYPNAKTCSDEVSKKVTHTLENMISRYGEEEGQSRWQAYCDKQAIVGCKLEYFIDKYGEESGTIKYKDICKSKGITLENFIKKYGEVEGISKFEVMLGNKNASFISNLSKQISQKLIELIPSNWIFHEGLYGKEFCVYKERAYFYDFVITYPFRACIEINGDYWHANPKKYKADDVIQFPNKVSLAKEIWERDKLKNSIIEERGYKLFIIWEKDYNENPTVSIQKVMIWLNTLENA